jgi:hypothetical protein
MISLRLRFFSSSFFFSAAFAGSSRPLSEPAFGDVYPDFAPAAGLRGSLKSLRIGFGYFSL